MTSTLAATSPSPPSATSSPSQNGAPVPEHGMPMSRRNLIIILACVIGMIVITTVGFIVFSCRKKKHRLHLLKRAATPLSDAEFDLWRRPTKAPSVYKSGGTTVYKTTGTRLERYDPDLKSPSPICQVVRVDSTMANHSPRPITPPQRTQFPSSIVTNSPTTSTRPLIRSTSSAANTTHSRHKSSMSLQDRPPTPYSSSSPPIGWDGETLLSESVPQSPREKQHRVHYPSMSEASDFDFGFGYGPPDSPRRDSTRRESWVHHSRRFSSLGGQVHPSVHAFNLPEGEN